MRRAADLYAGEAATDRIDAFVIADTARARRTKLHELVTAASDGPLGHLRVLNGFDIAWLPASPERPTGPVTRSVRPRRSRSERGVGRW